MRGLPFVPWFTSDWLASSARIDMTLPERAVYLDLLFQIWERGGAIPSDHAKLSKMAMVTQSEFEAAWLAVSKYVTPHPSEPEMLTNLRMLDVISKQQQVKDAGRIAGLASAAARKKRIANDSATNVQQLERESELESEGEREAETHICASDDARVCGRSSSSPKRRPPATEATAEQVTWFEAWFDLFWLPRDRLRAFDAFCRHVKTWERFEQVMAATKQQLPEMMSKDRKHRPYPASWLDNERWLDGKSEADAMLDAMRERRQG
jgi:uncharacterized protein YdaU (DUF1376 family)